MDSRLAPRPSSGSCWSSGKRSDSTSSWTGTTRRVPDWPHSSGNVVVGSRPMLRMNCHDAVFQGELVERALAWCGIVMRQRRTSEVMEYIRIIVIFICFSSCFTLLSCVKSGSSIVFALWWSVHCCHGDDRGMKVKPHSLMFPRGVCERSSTMIDICSRVRNFNNKEDTTRDGRQAD